MSKAFTLVELILYMGIVSIMIAGVSNFAWVAIGTGQKSSSQQEVFSSARFAGDKIKNAIRSAIDINTGGSNFDSNLVLNPSQRLTLRGNAPNDPVVIDVSAGRVRMATGGGAAEYINSADTRVTNLTFTNYSSSDGKAKNVSFILTMQSAYTGSRQEYKADISLESAAELRNNQI